VDPQNPGSPGSKPAPPPPPWMPSPQTGGGSPPSPAPADARTSPPPLPPLGSSSEEPSPAPSTRRTRRLLAVVVATLLVVGGSGAATAFLLFRGASEELLQLVPASSDVVVTAYLDPSAGQKVNLMTLVHRFPALRDDLRLGQEVDDALDEALRDSGLTHQDVLPWLGSQAAVVVDLGPTNDAPTTSVLIASTDDVTAAAALEEGLRNSLGNEETREYGGVTMHVFGLGPSFTSYAIVDHVVVLSDQTIGLTQAIDVSNGATQAIADDPGFLDTISSLPQGRLALAYVNAAEIVDEALAASGLYAATEATPGLETIRAIEGIGMSLSAHPDGLALDVAVRLDPSKLDPTTRGELDQPAHENTMLQFVPADSFVVATQEGVDASLRQVVDQALSLPEGERIRQRLAVDEVLAALTGDLAFEVGSASGPVPVGGAILIGVSDAAAAQRTLDGLAGLVLAAQRRSESFAPSQSGLSERELRELEASQPGPKAMWRTSTYQGTTIRYLDDPSVASTGFLPAYAVFDGAAVIGSSPAEIRKVIDVKNGTELNITASSTYTQALARVPSGGSVLYVDAAAVISMLTPMIPPDVSQNLGPFKTVVEGTSNTSSLITYRLFVEIG